MKKLLFFLCLSIALLSCNKDNPKSSLSGTIWFTTLGSTDGNLAIEFTSDSSVKTYKCSEDLQVYEKTIRTGSYSKDGDNITFNGLTYYRLTGDGSVLRGTLNSNGIHMSVTLKYHVKIIEKDYEESYSFVKKK